MYWLAIKHLLTTNSSVYFKDWWNKEWYLSLGGPIIRISEFVFFKNVNKEQRIFQTYLSKHTHTHTFLLYTSTHTEVKNFHTYSAQKFR